MTDEDPESRFPGLRPVKSAPALFRINGCGMGVYGRRDYDGETHTYVMTHCLCLLFIPVLAVGAYRVLDAPNGGWYFIGKVPISGFARGWNCLILAAVIALGLQLGWNHYTGTPDYLAARKIDEADRLAEAGQLAKAAPLYADVAGGKTGVAAQAGDKLKALLDGPVAAAAPDEAAAVFKVVASRPGRAGATASDLVDRAVAWANARGGEDPAGAARVLDTVAGLAPRADDLNKARQHFLEQAVARQPDDVELASQLAVVYEARGQLPKCEALLTPHRPRLALTEGARILGQLYAHNGKLEDAHALLVPYAEGRLKQLHAAEEALQRTYEKVNRRTIDLLNTRKAPNFSYSRYEAAGKAEQDRLVQDYVGEALKEDADFLAAQEAMGKQAEVVPVALDLGIIYLNRAQGLADPDARKVELEKAEKTFLSVRGLAGETEAYRLHLGQVYYWLGKPAEGRKLFDELLVAKNRDFEVLLGVAGLLRQVGAVADGRALVEEAYNNEGNATRKHQAALQRSLMYVDLDDQISWLRRSDPASTYVKAELAEAHGNKAMADGKDVEAAQRLREAIDAYTALPVNASTLNNIALCYFSLYYLTSDRQSLDQAIQLLEKAVALKPSDSILLNNAADTILENATRDVIGPAIDWKTLKSGAALDLLDYLYDDQAGGQVFAKRVNEHAGIQKAVAHFNRLLVLRPKDVGAYHTLHGYYRFTRDADALARLAKRLEEVVLEEADVKRRLLDHYAGKEDAKRREEITTAIKRSEAIREAAHKGPKGVTLAIALGKLAENKTALAIVGGPSDADSVVALAEEAHAVAPSRATRRSLKSALLFRAHQNLVKVEPAYAAMATRAFRSLGPSYLIAAALAREGKPRAAALANADVRRAIDLVLETETKFPDTPDEWTWAMLGASHPQEAPRIVKAYREDKLVGPSRAIGRKLSPLSGTDALAASWALEMAGKKAEAAALLKQAAAEGVPLP
jgi:tetratricopeptide (TPR) repeat protein